MSDPNQTPLRELLTRRWPAIEDAARTLAVSDGQTIRPGAPTGTESAHGRALKALLAHGSFSSDASRVRTHDVLGMGGMGVVHVGTQASLDRTVAVKSVRPDQRGPVSTLKLLQEAWIAGRLEHPNIVPVYDIGTDADGEPQIVLQRVEGQSWDTLCQDPDAVAAQLGASDLLDWNLRVLMQVCNAVAYAHSRGMIHLDLKPSNVMIGAYGEVLILDWGLAMSLRDDGSGRLPLARDNVEIVGTPSYMAPEMLAQEGDRLNERTDVYLLGATLYELCTGMPPHQGTNMLAIMFKIATETLDPPAGVPDELAAICARAMAMDPGDRHPTAEALRLEIAAFLEHRGSNQLADRAAALMTLLASAAGDGQPEEQLRSLFSTARFGFEQALSAWPDNPAAQQGLRDLLILRCRQILQGGDAGHAAAMLAAVADPPAALVEAVAQALERQRGAAERMEQLQAFHDEMDVRIGQRTRVFIIGTLGLGWTAVPLLRHFTAPLATDLMFLSFTIVPAVFLVVFLGLLVWARDSMMKTAINRRTSSSVIVLLVSQIVMTTLCFGAELTPEAMVRFNFVLWCVIATLFTATVDRRTLPMTAGFVLGLGATILWPAYSWLIMSMACLGLTLNAIVIWWPRPFLPERRPR